VRCLGVDAKVSLTPPPLYICMDNH
jgi:hypothetical protein